MHYLSSVYFVIQPLHVSGIFVAHHQEVHYICVYIYITIGTCCIYTVYLLMMGYKYARNMQRLIEEINWGINRVGFCYTDVRTIFWCWQKNVCAKMFLGCVVCIYWFTLACFLSKVMSCMPFLNCKHKTVYAVAALCRKSTSFSFVFLIVFLLF